MAVNLTIYHPPFPISYEKEYQAELVFAWFREHWVSSFWFSLAYVLVIFSVKHVMKDREKFHLRIPLAMWSGLLAVFSILAAVRSVSELLYMWTERGFEATACDPSNYYGPTGFWVFLFCVSKVLELGDTLFIVLRKTPLIVLHWYHHITVMIYVWYTQTEQAGPGRWFMAMNCIVHSVMYTYYTLKALRVHMPRALGMSITTLQITQMLMGLVINTVSYRVRSRGGVCQQSVENWTYCCLMYFSYFVLFAHFFYNAYVTPKSSSQTSVSKDPNANDVMNGRVDTAASKKRR